MFFKTTISNEKRAIQDLWTNTDGKGREISDKSAIQIYEYTRGLAYLHPLASTAIEQINAV